jgi:restriction system protein
MASAPVMLLTDTLQGDGPARILIRGFVDGLLLVWPLWVALGLLVVGAIIWGVAVRVLRRRRLAHSGIADIDRFGGKTFEQYLEILFQRLGYAVERTRFVGDYGGDLVLRKDGVRTVVQAKRYSQSVGVRAVQEAVAAKAYYGCTEAMVVSNSRYTKQAAHLAHKNKVVLWDRDVLVRQLAASGAKQQVHDATTPSPTAPPAQPTRSLADQSLATVEACGQCSKILTAGERQYCERNAKRFGGRMLCFRHQRTSRT